jgi:hypothetical protein
MGKLIRIQLISSIRIRTQTQGAKPMRIHEDPDLDAGQILKLEKVDFFYLKIYFKYCR